MTSFNLITDREIVEGYLTDASNIKGHAEGLFRPSSTQEVSDIVQYCQQNNIPLTVTAQRTSTTGGPVPFGGMLLSTERMNTIYSDTEVDVSVFGISGRAKSKGLVPPDPTSRNECSIEERLPVMPLGANVSLWIYTFLGRQIRSRFSNGGDPYHR